MTTTSGSIGKEAAPKARSAVRGPPSNSAARAAHHAAVAASAAAQTANPKPAKQSFKSRIPRFAAKEKPAADADAGPPTVPEKGAWDSTQLPTSTERLDSAEPTSAQSPLIGVCYVHP